MGQPSLVRRLLITLVLSLTFVAVLLGAGGAWLINGIVEQTSDKLLGASARAIAETLAEEDGEITLDLPPSALGMLENTERDNIYYSVRRDKDLVTGYPDLAPAPAADLSLEHVIFRYDRFRNQRIRVAVVTRKLPRITGAMVVEVAETLVARRELAERMLAGLATLEVVFIAVAALLVWPAVRWSLRPVTKLRARMEHRATEQALFRELPIAGVPVELVDLVAGFNALIQQVEASVQGMRRFTADASHQMRTPLSILRTHLAILQKYPPQSAIGRTSVADIVHATERLQNLLTGLLSLARADDAVDDQSVVETRLGTLAREVAADYQPLAAKNQVKLHVETIGEDVAANADALLVTQILSNLVDNAIRYNRFGGSVVIRNGEIDGRPYLTVVDDGPGVPDAEMDRIFQRFFRLPRDHGQPGSGLGLSIVSTLTQRLGARLSATSTSEGGGLSVNVSFEP